MAEKKKTLLIFDANSLIHRAYHALPPLTTPKGEMVNAVYGDVTHYGSFILLFATIAFAYQLYCDFSGYCDIAIGSAQILGIRLVENFNRPYAAKSIADFWRRWHISLSSWLRDYLYMPMIFAVKRKTRGWLYFSLFVTFVAIGFWHGAEWTFVAMGALHGAYLVGGILTEPLRKRVTATIGLSSFPRIHGALQTLITFVLVMISWIFFRAADMHEAWYIVSHLATGWGAVPAELYSQLHTLVVSHSISKTILISSFFAIVVMEFIQRSERSNTSVLTFPALPRWARMGMYYALLFMILLFGYTGAQPFIYFKF